MAAIDKIYGTRAQYDEFYQWCEVNVPEAIKHFNTRWTEEMKTDCNSTHAICNLPMELDGIILLSEPPDFVISQIIEQYDLPFMFTRAGYHDVEEFYKE